MNRRIPLPNLTSLHHTFWKAAAQTTEIVLESRPLIRRFLALVPIIAAAGLAYLLGRFLGSLVPITW